MNWFSLIPAALGALGGLFGGGQNTSTTTNSTQMSPALTAAAGTALSKANTILAQPYEKYPGERVAQPTAARAAVSPLMGQMGTFVSGQLANGNGAIPRISQLMARGPARVTAPTLVPTGAPSAQLQIPGA